VIDTPKFLQGLFSFEGKGLDQPLSPMPRLSYRVPFDKRAQLLYCRAGNSCPELIYLLITRDGKPMRYFPLGAKSDCHVPLAVVEDLRPDTELEVLVAAPASVSGTVVLDIGLVEI
jgi:hypothetical protein